MKTKLRDIILVETSFNRSREIDFNEKSEYDTTIKIVNGVVDNSHLVVEMEYKFEIFRKEKESESQFFYSSKHIAQFDLEEYDSEEEGIIEKLKRFANINAAAMIYPFIRENAATISAKAGMSPIIIPVTNFIERYESLDKESE
ncbi:protein-export chaperone SecB [Elizabethkingia anophelis]|uniref:protein-export chaperone SecB n=1 Tax=Elizabethkingia TaxID=308865 RepID=UPI0007399024|nr:MULTISPECIES: protein-export chaperone SecB [Elizabethkingia]KUF46422.1 hypothetical protein AS358_14565 [Elizabethkingia anophelis]MCT3645162.1 protein-export chaperone SecB [Elizabethkingia anophelis]MCT3652969.1 protein-export chaperone SecB [Elizabethkingia anophelis]MCT3656161.1 protein-export chaperone SecB [Elizabethkingia anophelis]MCT3660209.1 protein-export chaperone SecB [Elizabethkingia anophelis]